MATDIERCDTVDAVCERTVSAAKELLAFNSCVVDTEEDSGRFDVRARSANVPTGSPLSVSVKEGVLGRTFRSGEATLVADLDYDPEAIDQHTYSSALGIPVGEIGVFLALATEPDAFDEENFGLVGLLVAHATEALTRIKGELALREERDRFAALFEMIPEPVGHVRFEDGRPIVQAVNSTFEEAFGLDESEVVGGTLNEHIVPLEYEEEAREIDERSRSGKPVTREVRRETTDGIGHFLFRSIPIDASANEGFGIYVDITEQKERQRQLECRTSGSRSSDPS